MGAAAAERAVGGMAAAVGSSVRVGWAGGIAVATSGVGREPQPVRPQAAPAADTVNNRLMKARRSSVWVMIGLLAGSQDNLVEPSYQSGPEFGMRGVILGWMGSWAVTRQAV